MTINNDTIFDEFLNLEFSIFGKHQKKEPDNAKEKPALTNEERNRIYSELKRIVTKYNNDPSVKKRVVAALKNLDGNYKYVKFICRDEGDAVKSEAMYVICDEDQEYRSAVLDIINDMAKDLKNVLNNPSLKIDTGDGDEGCIYVEKKS